MAGGTDKKIHIRRVMPGDVSRGLLETLADLTRLEGLTQAKAKKLIKMLDSDKKRKMLVAVDKSGAVVGTATLLVEQKLTYNGGRVGHIEDVVVRKVHERRGLGSLLVRAAMEHAKRQGCFRVILDCRDYNVPFYEKLGFKKVGNEMRLEFGH